MQKKILILDSKEAIVEMIKEVMFSEGYRAKGIILTEEFTQAVECYQPDLILVDYNLLSRYNGEELCRQIKSNPKTIHIPVIMISTYPRSLNPLNDYSPDAFIHKPFSLERLTGQVKNLLCLKN